MAALADDDAREGQYALARFVALQLNNAEFPSKRTMEGQFKLVRLPVSRAHAQEACAVGAGMRTPVGVCRALLPQK